MKCPYCGNDNTKVIDSRIYSEGNSIKRRRECEKCEKRFTTHEKVVDLSLIVIKKNGQKEPYMREKLYSGIKRAVEKRNVSNENIDFVLDKIEREILTKYSGEISSKDLGNMMISYLFDLDEIAYIRFVSVYKQFNSLNDFINEIEKIKKMKK